MSKFRPIFLALAFLGLLIACTNPYAMQQGGVGTLRLSGVHSGGIGAATVFPEVDLSDIESYEITLTDGPNAGEFEPRTVASDEDGQLDAGSGLEFEDLVPGDWTVQVRGFSGADGTGDLLVSGAREGVQISRGDFTDVTVTVYLVDDPDLEETGEWILDLDWPEDAGDYSTTDVVTGYSVSFEPFDGQDVTDATIDETDALDADGRRLSLSGTDFVPGPYLMDIELHSDNKSPYKTVARYTEIWYVYGNQTTARAEGEPGDGPVELSEADFSFGGGARFGVTVEQLADLEQFFDDSKESSVASGSGFTISADLVDSDGEPLTADNLTWRVNSQEVTDGEDVVITEGSEEDEIGLVTGVSIESDGSQLSFIPDQGWDDDEEAFSEDLDFPAGVTLNVTLIVEEGGEYYSGSHSVTVEEAD